MYVPLPLLPRSAGCLASATNWIYPPLSIICPLLSIQPQPNRKTSCRESFCCSRNATCIYIWHPHISSLPFPIQKRKKKRSSLAHLVLALRVQAWEVQNWVLSKWMHGTEVTCIFFSFDHTSRIAGRSHQITPFYFISWPHYSRNEFAAGTVWVSTANAHHNFRSSECLKTPSFQQQHLVQMPCKNKQFPTNHAKLEIKEAWKGPCG